MSIEKTIHWLANSPEELNILCVNAGITLKTIEDLRGPRAWGPIRDKEMHKALTDIIFGAAKLSHLQEIDLPATYVGKIIAEFVHPNNWMVACHLFRRTCRS